jgi:hypothetical protein
MIGVADLARTATLEVHGRPDGGRSDALKFIDQCGPAPFFVWVHLYDPHAPYAPPPEFRGRTKSAYDDEVAYADAEATCRISKARMATCRGDQMRNMGMARPAVFIRSRNLFKVIAVHPVFVSPWPAMGGDKPLPQITLDFIETCAASLEGKRVGRCACTCRRLGWNACVWVDDMDRVWADKYCPTGTGENRP